MRRAKFSSLRRCLLHMLREDGFCNMRININIVLKLAPLKRAPNPPHPFKDNQDTTGIYFIRLCNVIMYINCVCIKQPHLLTHILSDLNDN